MNQVPSTVLCNPLLVLLVFAGGGQRYRVRVCLLPGLWVGELKDLNKIFHE